MFQDNEPPSVTLQIGDRLVIERGAARPPVQGQVSPQSGEYQLRLFRGGKDQGLITMKDESGKDQAVTLSRENPTVRLEGKGAMVEVSRASGINAADFIPRLDIRTEEPLAVTGGAFTSAAESTQVARVPATPAGLANVSITKEKGSDGLNIIRDDEALKESEENDKRYAAGTMLLKMMGQQTRYSMAAEQGSAGIQFINPREKDEDKKDLFLLTGKESLADNQQRYAAFADGALQSTREMMANKKTTAAEKAAQGIPTTIPEEKVPSLNEAQRKEVRTEGAELSKLIGSAGRGRGNSGSRPDDDPALKPYFDDANSVAASFMNTGTPSADRIKRLDAALDKLIELSGSNKSLDAGKLQKAKESFGRTRELAAPKEKKTGMAEGAGRLSPDVLAAAREAVDPAIRGQQAVDRDSPDAPRPVANPLSNSGGRTV